MPHCIRHGAFCLVLLHILPVAGFAQRVPDRVVRVEVAWSNPQAHAGDKRVLAVVLDIEPGYHVNPDARRLHDDLLIPTQLGVTSVGDGLSTEAVYYPHPAEVEVGPVDAPRLIQGYEGRVVLYVPVNTASGLTPGERSLELELTYQACDRHVCLPPVTVQVVATLTVVDPATPIAEADHADLFADFDARQSNQVADQAVTFDAFGWGFAVSPGGLLGFVTLLSVAALGGFLLNFTPCVLPVIPLKMMGLSHAAANRSRCLLLGVAMSLGVVAFWLALGVAIATVSGFTATNQLFQYPAFTVLVGVVIAVMAVGMMDLFSVTVPRFIYAVDPRRDTVTGSFLLGVMTAVLSTPCTAPFMGAAAAWAATQQPVTTLAAFGAIGGGMALPYLLLAAFPQWIARMPRSGPASLLIKQVMGLLLLAVGAYFLGVGLSGLTVTPPDPPSVLYWWVVMAAIAGAGAWLAVRTPRLTASVARRAVFVGLGGALALSAVYGGVRLTDRGPIDWAYYTPERFADAQRNGRVVVLDFTAEWCLNCKWLEKNVLQQANVVQRLNGDGVVAMKVDLTGRNETGNRLLKQVGRVAIPLLVVFAPDGREVFKSDVYTAGQVINAIDQARQ